MLGADVRAGVDGEVILTANRPEMEIFLFS
jgi:hypothetical protein